MLPTQEVDDERENGGALAQAALPLDVVEAAIKTVLHRNNYGLDGIAGGKAPAAVCVWRWEVKAQHRDWLPKNAREKAEQRLAERVQAKQDLLAIFQSLPQDAQDAILDPKGTNKLPQKELNIIEHHPISEEKVTPQSKQKQKKKEEEENDSSLNTSASKPARVPKPVDPAKLLKEQERLEKKAAKAEKEKKEKVSQDKSRSIMANFFSKPKGTPRTPAKGSDMAVAGPSKVTSEYTKNFKPFVLKKDTELAPINWFQESRKHKHKSSPVKIHDGVIVIDDEDDDEAIYHSANVDIANMSPAEHLESIVSSFASTQRHLVPSGSRPTRNSGLKTYNPLCVRALVSKLSAAEIEGDDAAVRSLLSQLNNRTQLPAKVLIFSDDNRPGYFGTWTRDSSIIGPRTPFARDVVVFDYGYDSGAEWEEEPAGDGDDVVDDGEDDDDGDDADSDADSWLVDDDEEVGGVPFEDMDQLDIPQYPPPPKRKAEDSDKHVVKKRKVVIPLVPYAKGPFWESSIGQCEHNVFDSYRIQMFNDTPLSFDPFAFVSTCLEESKRETKAVPSMKTVVLDDGAFVVPSLPDRFGSSNALQSNQTTPLAAAIAGPPKRMITPKQPFPDQHLPLVLEKIESLQTGSINFLVEAIHRELREQKIKKNTIEAKIREVGEKCKEKKCWIVKRSIQLPKDMRLLRIRFLAVYGYYMDVARLHTLNGNETLSETVEK
ncbi:hypothetical protein H0H93_007254 [Arthromyces matolae]|nr:hypothetical protein H0H93_007254 [Arthromyces matolae]